MNLAEGLFGPTEMSSKKLIEALVCHRKTRAVVKVSKVEPKGSVGLDIDQIL